MIPIFLGWIMGSFGAYRLGLMVSEEEGFLGMFEAFRNLFLQDHWMGRGVRCFRCTSFWAALPLSLLVSLYAKDYLLLPLLWASVAGGAVVIEKYWKR